MNTVALLVMARIALAWICVFGGNTPLARRVMMDFGSCNSYIYTKKKKGRPSLAKTGRQVCLCRFPACEQMLRIPIVRTSMGIVMASLGCPPGPALPSSLSLPLSDGVVCEKALPARAEPTAEPGRGAKAAALLAASGPAPGGGRLGGGIEVGSMVGRARADDGPAAAAPRPGGAARPVGACMAKGLLLLLLLMSGGGGGAALRGGGGRASGGGWGPSSMGAKRAVEADAAADGAWAVVSLLREGSFLRGGMA